MAIGHERQQLSRTLLIALFPVDFDPLVVAALLSTLLFAARPWNAIVVGCQTMRALWALYPRCPPDGRRGSDPPPHAA